MKEINNKNFNSAIDVWAKLYGNASFPSYIVCNTTSKSDYLPYFKGEGSDTNVPDSAAKDLDVSVTTIIENKTSIDWNKCLVSKYKGKCDTTVVKGPSGFPIAATLDLMAAKYAKSFKLLSDSFSISHPTNGKEWILRILHDGTNGGVIYFELDAAVRKACITDIDCGTYLNYNTKKETSLKIELLNEIVDDFNKAWTALKSASLLSKILTDDGSLVPRFIAGTHTFSEHTFGEAFDFNYFWNQFGSKPAISGALGDMNAIASIFKDNNFKWGGDWVKDVSDEKIKYANCDGMHIEHK